MFVNSVAGENCATLGKFKCNDGRTCASLCDGFPECPTSEDEIRCNGICPDNVKQSCLFYSFY